MAWGGHVCLEHVYKQVNSSALNKILSHEGLVEALVDLYRPWSRVSFSPEDKHVDVGSAQTSPPADWEARAGGWAFAGQCRTL